MRRDANGLEPSSLADMVDGMLNSTGLASQGNDSTVTYSMTTDVSVFASLSNSTFQVPYINASEYEFSRENVANCSLVPGGCKFGLFHDYQVI